MSDARSSLLKQFFGAWFHQDWDLDADTPDEIVTAYARALNHEDIRALRDAILEYVAGHDDLELDGRLFSELGCSYDPDADGMSSRAWLEKVAEQLNTIHGASRND